MPATTLWLRQQRDGPPHPASAIRHGINASLIVQCTMFFDGLIASGLTHALETPRDLNSNTARLQAEYHDRVHRENAFAKNSRMFRIITGKTLSELMQNDERWKSLDILFKFRNGLAHGRLLEYRVYFDRETAQYDPDFSGSYADVEKYLLEKNLINTVVKNEGSAFHFLENNIADHFCGLLRPLSFDIASFFPDYVEKHLKAMIDDAFKQWPHYH